MTANKAKPNRRFKLLITLLVLLAVAAAAGFLGYKTLRADHIVVQGNRELSSSYIMELSGIQPGQHYLSIDFQKARERLESDPYIDVNNVYFVFPDTVVIDIEERQVAAAIRQMESTVLIDSEGMVLDITASTSNLSGILVIKGMAITGAAVGEEIAAVDEYQVEALRILLESLLNTQQYALYAEADMTYSVDIWLVTHEGMQVRLGQAYDLDNKLMAVRSVIYELNGQGITTGTLIATDSQSVYYSPDVSSLPDEEGEDEVPEGEPDAEAPDEVLPDGEDGDLSDNGEDGQDLPEEEEQGNNPDDTLTEEPEEEPTEDTE